MLNSTAIDGRNHDTMCIRDMAAAVFIMASASNSGCLRPMA